MVQPVQEDTINLKELFNKLLDKWQLFLISILICLFAAFLYSVYTPPTYIVNAKLLVNDDEKGGGLGKQAGALMDLGGIMGSKNSVDNEVEILKTRFLMEQVVRDMQLNIVYSKKINLLKRELYNSPFKIIILKGVDTLKTKVLEVNIIQANRFKVSCETFHKEVGYGETFNIDGIGLVEIAPTQNKVLVDEDYYITINSIDDRVATLMNQLSVSPANKMVSIIDLALKYTLPQKGEDILNTLIKKYSQANLSDKNAIADSTYHFIKERINKIAAELGDVENEVEVFKKNNQLADMTEQGKLLVQSTSEFTNELAKSETQVSVLNDLEKYLNDGNNNKRVFPSSLIPADMVFSNLMNQYNVLLIERERQLLSVTEESPFIQNIDKQIAGLKNDILTNIQSAKNTSIATRNKLKDQVNKAEGKISEVPLIEKNYLKLARNQQIKQELYIFLMQKAEETAISKTSNNAIAKVIDPPKSQNFPISPKKQVIYLAGLVAGMAIPLLIILAQNLLNTAISTKEDILALTKVPVIGEINHNDTSDNLIVANQSRSAISEQFRALRTNLSFYLKNSNQKAILVTSSMSGEGKSFSAINLANTLALTGKKVLLMELDLRKPGLSAKLNISNSIGFSNYTIDESVSVKDIIKPLTINKNMFIISSGPLPPNPAETLMSERMPELINQLKTEFDYIIMDAPPIGIIADAQLLSIYCDATLYIVRQKVTQKQQLNIVEELYNSSKMNNIGIVVNDIVDKNYGYGYRYGNYGQVEEESLIEKIKRKINLN
ncbi:polysaccharide biosynthesis tyrosine autokinase [Agrobacterium tumefaciens]|nr:polysaccharide biosynthesis tyrosine autokinase [Agrobacterium tumefaciens]NTE21949.1 polysaccharide biosynthesis tyrosine autokinase [Agrobacterium tumefaciens]